MKVKDVKGVCIVDIEGTVISAADIEKLRDLQKKNIRSKRIGVNMASVNSLDFNFLDYLKNSFDSGNKISLFNVNSDAFLSLFVLKYDQFTDIYMNETDFSAAKHSIVYRRFKLLKAA